MEEFSEIDGRQIAELSCQHIFHEDCLQEWVQKNEVCPLCRAPVLDSRDYLIWYEYLYLTTNQQNFNFISRINNFQLDSIGLFLIFFSILVYNSHTPFPGLYALIPIIGTLLIICFANQNTITGKFLGSKALVSIGLISYSAYLWHQPLLAFARLSSFSLLGQEFLLLICNFWQILGYFQLCEVHDELF